MYHCGWCGCNFYQWVRLPDAGHFLERFWVQPLGCLPCQTWSKNDPKRTQVTESPGGVYCRITIYLPFAWRFSIQPVQAILNFMLMVKACENHKSSVSSLCCMVRNKIAGFSVLAQGLSLEVVDRLLQIVPLAIVLALDVCVQLLLLDTIPGKITRFHGKNGNMLRG